MPLEMGFTFVLGNNLLSVYRFCINLSLVQYCMPLKPWWGRYTPARAYGESLNKKRQKFSCVQPLRCLHETICAMCTAQPCRAARQSKLSRLFAAESSIPHRLIIVGLSRDAKPIVFLSFHIRESPQARAGVQRPAWSRRAERVRF